MNRRGFLQTLGTVAAGFAILPAATTYARKWAVTRSAPSGVYEVRAVINPEWINAPYEMVFAYASPEIPLGKCALMPRMKLQGELGGFQGALMEPFPLRYSQEGELIRPFIIEGES